MSEALLQGLIGAIVLVASLSVSAASTDAWKASLFNPRPADDDLILPMPCGGAMAFRPVAAEAEGPLGDLRVELGSDAEDQGHTEHTHPAFVAGSFPVPKGGRRAFLMGKYEVSALQYAAVEAADDPARCPKPTSKGRLPQTRVSWFDAVRFAHDYSLWLQRNAASLSDCNGSSMPCLPRVDGVPAFARLPTETEWEFAARGGARVTPADFRELRFPMPQGVARHAWFNETADGKVHPIGVLDPNPLGLHDILGNVEEIVLEPFRLQRLERPHGQAGGYVVRGGSIHSSREELRSSLRREVPFYDERGAVGTADTGLRLVLSAPVLTSQERLNAVRAAWEGLGTDQSKPEAPPPQRPILEDKPFADPVLELTALARAAPDPVMKRRLERLRAAVADNAQRRYEQRNRTAREMIRFGGVLCLKLHDEGHNLEVNRRIYGACVEANGADFPRCKQRLTTLEKDRGIIAENVGFYADSVVRTAQTFPNDLDVLAEQLARLKDEIAARGYADYAAFPAAFHRQVAGYAKAGRVERDGWFEECVGLPQNRARDRGPAP